jgi:hypothetical protein
MVDVASESKEALEGIGDVGLDLLRGHAAVERSHHDHGDLDLREQVDRHADHVGESDNHDPQTQHEDEKWILDCETRHTNTPSYSILFKPDCLVLAGQGTIEETVDRRHVSASRVAFSSPQCIVLQTSHGTNSVTGNSIRMKNGCLMANPDMI